MSVKELCTALRYNYINKMKAARDYRVMLLVMGDGDRLIAINKVNSRNIIMLDDYVRITNMSVFRLKRLINHGTVEEIREVISDNGFIGEHVLNMAGL